MPKKTRKEKIIAQLRRKLETEMGNQKMEISLQNISLPNPTSHVPPPTSNLSSSVSNLSISHIVKDLRKTFFLAGLAISLEVVLYLIWH